MIMPKKKKRKRIVEPMLLTIIMFALHPLFLFPEACYLLLYIHLVYLSLLSFAYIAVIIFMSPSGSFIAFCLDVKLAMLSCHSE
jgi:hypothetical protein